MDWFLYDNSLHYERVNDNASASEYFYKLAFKKETKNKNLNGCIWKARVNSEPKLTFSESSFNFLLNIVVFCTL